MDGAKVYLQPAYILQHKPYRETSLILDVFSRDYGLISIMAKGVRKSKSKTAGVLLPFSLLNLSYLDRHDLKLLVDVEFQIHHELSKLSLYCGFYVNELIQRFLHKHDPNPELFQRYQRTLLELAMLTGTDVETCLRSFELDLLEQAGYAVVLDIDAKSGLPVEADMLYSYMIDEGMVQDTTGHIEGATLIALAKANPLTIPAQQQQAKHLLRLMLAPHLQGKPLKSRAVLARVMHYL